MKSKVIVLVGRPNVGKSTLFNRLSIKKKAIVHNQPGVTRDRNYSKATIGSLEFTVVDTPGLEEAQPGKLEYRMTQQTIEAMLDADLICLMVDGKEGVTPADKYFAGMIRKYNKPQLLIVNKCERKFDFNKDYYSLGMGQMVAVSAEHSLGMADLYEAIEELLHSHDDVRLAPTPSDPIKDNYLQIAIVGRPNSGKSTFINSIIGAERVLTGAEAGITRESIEIDWQYKEQLIKIIDTAGLRRRSLVTGQLEKLSTSDTIHSINFANVVVLMVSALTPLDQQDLNIASYVIEEGRNLIIAVNKWDLIAEKQRQEFKKSFANMVETNLSQVKGVPVIFISALNNERIYEVMDEAIAIYALWNKKIRTSKLNEWLSFVVEEHPLPLQKNGRRVRIKYITQTKARPPTFKLFANKPEKITDSYRRYLINNLRQNFNLPGVPIRMLFAKSDNPYVS